VRIVVAGCDTRSLSLVPYSNHRDIASYKDLH